MWNSFALAVQALTCLPAQNDLPPTPDEARRAVCLFPLVGAFVGVISAAGWTVADRVWHGQSLVPAALTLAVGLLVTGGQGLSGIARAADGLAAYGGGGDQTRAFAIMRDPRRGNTGLVALGAFLVLRLAFLAALPASLAWPALILTGAMGGWAMAFSYSAFSVAASEGGSGLAEAGPGEFLAATAVTIVCGAILPKRGLLTLLAVSLVAGPIAQTVNRRLGSLNRPLCAAFGEIAELTALACLSIRT